MNVVIISFNISIAIIFLLFIITVLLPKWYEHTFPKFIYTSEVEDHEGICVPVWVNHSEIDYRTTGIRTGFFRSVKKNWFNGYSYYGEEFHGYFAKDRIILSTKGMH